jgi:hypothetical protein
LFSHLGINLDSNEPLYEPGLSVGGGFETTPVYAVSLTLLAPTDSDGSPLTWTLELGARRRWRLPFAVLFGQRGWFDHFPTRIDGATSMVEID